MRDTSARRERIVSMLRSNRSVQVQALKDLFSVSAVTIRKDLRFLEKRGIATRAYGGAIINDINLQINESGLEFKRQLNVEKKSNIAFAAASLISDGDSIILDSGTTTQQIAAQLKNKNNVTVVTNDLTVMNQIAGFDNLELLVLGGLLRRKNLSLFGPQAEHALKNLHVDKLFLGVDGFHMDKGITTHFEAESTLNRIMCEAASEIIVVTDSSKFSKICLYKILAPSAISKLVTDTGIPEEYLEGLQNLGVEVIMVDMD